MNLTSSTNSDINGEYYYIRNAQGDIIGLFDKAGALVVSYTYDSWGKLISTTGTAASTVGVKNPYRYRGYRYDTETGLYYLQSRYYNAEWGRFVNADTLLGETGELLSHNIFAYCQGSPINYLDTIGYNKICLTDESGGSACGSGTSASSNKLSKFFQKVFNSVTGKGAAKASDNPIINNIKNKVPNEEVTPPQNPGNAPISNKDGRPIEIHHSDQNPQGSFYDMHPSDHRYGENYQKNHPNYNEPSKIDRKQFRNDKREYWENEWDNGRWK
jgi:RHS repeat-associated protein